MKTSSVGNDLCQKFSTLYAALTIITVLFLSSASAMGKPRVPWAPLIPEIVPPIWREGFDDAFWLGSRDTTLSFGGFSLTADWSGCALQRGGFADAPFVVPAVDSSGRTNIACDFGALRVWFNPWWSSSSVAGGMGPGADATLLELGTKEALAVWELRVSKDGSSLYLLGEAGAVVLLQADIAWLANVSNLVVLNYSPQRTDLFLDGTLVAEGEGTVAVPANVAALTFGSTITGAGQAGGGFDELGSFNRPLSEAAVAFYANAVGDLAKLGPMTAKEIEREQALAAQRAQAKMKQALLEEAGGMAGLMMARGSSGLLSLGCECGCNCATGGQVYFTNVVAALTTSNGVDVILGISGGSNGVIYGVYAATNLLNPQWKWLGNSYTCSTIYLTNQPAEMGFYMVRPKPPTMVMAWGDNSSGQSDVPSGLTNAIAVTGGDDDVANNILGFSAALRADGTVVAWGNNTHGQTNVPSGLSGVVAIAAGPYHGLALRFDGTLSAWGSWWTIDSTNLYPTVPVPTGLTNVIGIAAGVRHDLAVRCDGSVTAWGYYPDDSYVVVPTNLPPAQAVAAGWYHSVALLTNGTVAVWGYNWDDIVSGGFNITNTPAGLSNVTAIAAGGFHTLALKSDGTVVAWGVGSGSSTNWLEALFAKSVFEKSVPECARPRAQQGEYFRRTRKVHARRRSNVAAPEDGRTPSTTDAASKAHFQTGSKGQSTAPTGLSNVVAIAAGLYYSMALKSDGTVVTWGDLSGPGYPLNQIAGIGSGWLHALVIRSSPLTPIIVTQPTNQTVSVNQNASFNASAVGLAVITYQWHFSGVDIQGATNASLSLTNVQRENAGNYQAVVSNGFGSVTSSVAVLTVLRTAFGPGLISGWGSNTNRQLLWRGDATNVISLVAGNAHGIAALENGKVMDWGSYWTGTNFVPVTSPPSLTNAVAVAAGARHDLALTADGKVIAWGWNDFGQTNVPSSATNAIAISAGRQQSLALKKDGTVVQWGQTNALVPSGLTNVTAIASGTNFHLALLQNSTVVAWGANNYGQTNVPANLSNVVAIAAGGAHALALKDNGTVTAWGSNGSGETNVPTSLTNAMAVAAGEAHSVALRNNGAVVCWGDNSKGQLNVISNLPPVKLIAAGGDFTLASQFSPLTQYTVDVTRDLLLIYNTNSTESIFVKDYYLAHRPMVGGANVLGIGCTNNPSIRPEDYTNTIAAPVRQWLSDNPTKRPEYVILFAGIPWRVNTNATPLGIYQGGGSPESGGAARNSVQYKLYAQCTSDWQPFITSINMGEFAPYNGVADYAIYTNACKAYIDKLEFMGTNNSPGRLVISASAGGYGNTDYYFDDCPYTVAQQASDARTGVLSVNPSASITFSNGVDDGTNLAVHITSGTNVVGYLSHGLHSALLNQYAIDGKVKWYGNSGWWIIETVESYNGQPGAGMGDFFQWFSATAFGGTNYSNTPVGAVTHVDEPGGCCVNDAFIYFGLWEAKKNFATCAWISRNTGYFQAVGDPFVTR